MEDENQRDHRYQNKPPPSSSLSGHIGRWGFRWNYTPCFGNRVTVVLSDGSIHVYEFVHGEDRLTEIRQRQLMRFSFNRIARRTPLKLGVEEGSPRFQFGG
jgi:hypothetical protein